MTLRCTKCGVGDTINCILSPYELPLASQICSFLFFLSFFPVSQQWVLTEKGLWSPACLRTSVWQDAGAERLDELSPQRQNRLSRHWSLKERGEYKGSARHLIRRGRDRTVSNQSNINTPPKATLRSLLGSFVGCLTSAPSSMRVYLTDGFAITSVFVATRIQKFHVGAVCTPHVLQRNKDHPKKQIQNGVATTPRHWGRRGQHPPAEHNSTSHNL